MNISMHNSGIALAALAMLAGCSLGEIHDQVRLVETMGTIQGRVELSGVPEGRILIKRYILQNGVYDYQSFQIASPKGDYSFHVSPGDYYLAAFVDSDRNSEYDSTEAGNYYSLETGEPAPIHVDAGQTATVPILTITGKPPVPPKPVETQMNLLPAWKNLGRVITLDDPVFSLSNYSMGMWKPVTFLKQIGGGVYFLQEYQSEKIPVLFIHGMNGGPTDWATVIRSIDCRHFQPWVLYYPSGLTLSIISDYLATAVAELHEEYQFRQLYVVSFSAGGLVARSFVKMLHSRFPGNSHLVRFMATVSSPMDGMASALRGVQNSPIVVPSWRDVATDSEFIRDLQEWEWPSGIPYYLFFSYESGDSGDGVVELQSQLPLRLQSEAEQVYGFNDTHTGILNNTDFIRLFNETLEKTRMRQPK